jgi:RNA polymerase sigma factor (sigma-70 family)
LCRHDEVDDIVALAEGAQCQLVQPDEFERVGNLRRRRGITSGTSTRLEQPMSATLARTISSAEHSDAELIDHVRHSHSDAFTILYERHVLAARAYARSLTRCASDADDLVSEAFTRLLELVQEHRGPTTDFRPYLLCVVRNLANDGYRRERRTSPAEDVGAGPSTADTLQNVIDQFDEQSALRALATLPESWQDILWRIEVLDIRPRQLARETAESARNISALAHRARQGLRNAYLSESNGHGRSSCSPIVDRLGAYCRDRIRPQERQFIHRHLSNCAECRSSLEAIREQAAELSLECSMATPFDHAV